MKLFRHRIARVLSTPTVLKALRLARAGVLAASGAGLMVVGVSHYHAFARVHEVEVVGNTHASAAAVRHLAGVRLGDPLLLLDLDPIVAEVARHPWVAEATVSRVFPGVLRVEVVEHEDVMLLMHDGGLYRVNAQGEVFVRARGADLDLPILTGLSTALVDEHPDVARRILAESLSLLDAVERTPSLAVDAISELHFDRSLGFSLKLRNGSVIFFGFRPVDPQLQRLEAMVASGLDLGVPTRVDLDLEGLAVATPLRS